MHSLCHFYLRKGKKDPRNYRLTMSVSEKVMQQLILETISRHMKDKMVIAGNHHRFTKIKSCLTDSLLQLVGSSVDEESLF